MSRIPQKNDADRHARVHCFLVESIRCGNPFFHSSASKAVSDQTSRTSFWQLLAIHVRTNHKINLSFKTIHENFQNAHAVHVSSSLNKSSLQKKNVCWNGPLGVSLRTTFFLSIYRSLRSHLLPAPLEPHRSRNRTSLVSLEKKTKYPESFPRAASLWSN